MRWIRLSIIALVSFLIVAGGAFFKKSIALSLCSILSFNSLTCTAHWSDRNQANATLPPDISEVEPPSEQLSQDQKMAGICFLGICAPVNLPKPVENLIQGGIDKAVQQQLRSLLADQIPISGSDHKFYPSVSELPGAAFAPQTLYLTDLPSKTAIPAGDYEIPVHFYCTGVYSFNGRGNRYTLAQLKGRMAEALSALYTRTSYDKSASINDIQTLAWAMQSGMAYNELAAPQKALVDKYIPEYRESMQSSFIDRLTSLSGEVSRISGGRIPNITQVLNKLGPIGDVTQSLLRAREQILRTSFSHQPLAQEFSPQKDFLLEGGVEKTPWSQVQENVYMRSIAPRGALHDGTVQVRILNNGPRAAGSYQVAQTSSLIAASVATGTITAEDLLEHITKSVAVSEASGGQAAQAALAPTEKPIDTPLSGTANTYKPLLVIHGGLADESTNNVKSWASILKIREPYKSINGIIIKYFSWMDSSESKDFITQHLNQFPGSPIVIVGHSYGGDTAYYIVKNLKSTNFQLLVTLDPVSRWSPSQLPKPANTAKWVNVWVKDGGSFADLIAGLGGSWNQQKNADEDILIPGLTHADSLKMYQKVERDIISILQASPNSSP